MNTTQKNLLQIGLLAAKLPINFSSILPADKTVYPKNWVRHHSFRCVLPVRFGCKNT